MTRDEKRLRLAAAALAGFESIPDVSVTSRVAAALVEDADLVLAALDRTESADLFVEFESFLKDRQTVDQLDGLDPNPRVQALLAKVQAARGVK